LRDITGGGKPGKYTPAQKLYHLGVSLLILAAVGPVLLMLLKIDTPCGGETHTGSRYAGWGVIYVIHGFAGHGPGHHGHDPYLFRASSRRMAADAFHVPGLDNLQGIFGHHDPKRWKAKEDA
jgi:hypothetical protein